MDDSHKHTYSSLIEYSLKIVICVTVIVLALSILRVKRSELLLRHVTSAADQCSNYTAEINNVLPKSVAYYVCHAYRYHNIASITVVQNMLYDNIKAP